MNKVYLDDYEVGEKITSPGRTITESDITTFAGFTGDWHPLHTDVEYAKQTMFGERICHGMLNLTIASALTLRADNCFACPKTFIAFYGMESLRHLGPVKIGDTLRTVMEVTEIVKKDDKRGLLVTKNTAINQRDEEILVYTIKILVGVKPKS